MKSSVAMTHIGILLFVVFVQTGPASRLAAAEQRPNVVLILIDDQGYGDLSTHGNPILKTPNLDTLAAEAVQLSDFHVSPWCSPTRAALMTGRHSRKVGVHGTNRTLQHLATEAVTMADIFRANGYATGLFGKWHLGDRYPLRPVDRGFDEAVTFPDGAVTTVPDYWGNDYYDDTYLHNGKEKRYEGYCTDVWFDLALEFIEKNKDRPFFCYLPTNAPHGPFIVAEQYAKPYRGKPGVRVPEFYGMIANIDENVGRFRKRLAELGLDDNTILIYLGDNGTAAGDFNAGMRGKKTSPYEGGHRVECFIRYPAGGLSDGRVVDNLAAHIDILPTLVDLAGLETDSQQAAFDGINLKPALLGQGPGEQDRVLIESFSRGVLTERWRLVNPASANQGIPADQGRAAEAFQKLELYDIQKDPAQQQDVAAQFPEVVAELREALRKYYQTEDLRPYYIVIGSDEQNPVTLTGEDWKFGTLIFQNSVAAAKPHHPQSKWEVQVAQAGRYRLALRRWPRETETAINAALPKEKWCHGMTRAGKLNAVQAVLHVGDAELTVPVTDETQEAEFTVELPAGNTTLQAWFEDQKQQQWFGPYLYVERIDGDEE